MYIPSIGVLVAVSWTLGWLAEESRERETVVVAASVAAVAVLSMPASA